LYRGLPERLPYYLLHFKILYSKMTLILQTNDEFRSIIYWEIQEIQHNKINTTDVEIDLIKNFLLKSLEYKFLLKPSALSN
jgi:hypothetical protein